MSADRPKGLRERIVPVERTAGDPFDYGKFEIVVEEIPEVYQVPNIVECGGQRERRSRPAKSY